MVEEETGTGDLGEEAKGPETQGGRRGALVLRRTADLSRHPTNTDERPHKYNIEKSSRIVYRQITTLK